MSESKKCRDTGKEFVKGFEAGINEKNLEAIFDPTIAKVVKDEVIRLFGTKDLNEVEYETDN